MSIAGAGIDAVILAGGRGTRLAAVLPDLPKPMAPVAGRPFLDYVLEYLARSKVISKVVLALGYRAESIIEHLDSVPPPLPTRSVVEAKALGTGGALLNALAATTSETILVLNADSLAAIDLAVMYRQHKSRNDDATLSLIRVPDAGRYGSVVLEGDRVRRFAEKAPGAGLVNAGIYLFQRSALVVFHPGPSSLEQDILPPLIATRPVGGFIGDGSFLDIGLPESYAEAADFVRRFAPAANI